MTAVADADVIVARAGLPAGVCGVIDTGWLTASGPGIPVEDPATGRIVATVGEASAADVDAAVRSAAAAQRAWVARHPRERGQILTACASGVRAAAGELASLESLDTGKPLAQARADVETSARYLEFYAGSADKLGGETIPSDPDALVYTVREPYGVVAHITPWNSPLAQMTRGVAPSLAAGNSVVVKPSEVTPLSTLAVARVLRESGLPAGLYNVVTGYGRATGDALVRHPGIDHITFTGSVPTGSAVLTAAAQRIVGCNLELGGKSPTIVMPDADLELAARTGAAAVIRNSGQSCFATTRLLVHRSRYDEFVEACVRHMGALTVGAGLSDPDLGPLSSAPHLAKVRGMVDDAVAGGAHVASGGSAPVRGLDGPLAGGHFMTPTLLVGVDNAMPIARTEVFGPVQSVLAFDTEDEAVAIANDSEYGLAAGVFTRDLATAHRLAGRLQAGQVQVNKYPAGGVETPFGGYKASGLGREKGLEALKHYSQLKTVIISVPR